MNNEFLDSHLEQLINSHLTELINVAVEKRLKPLTQRLSQVESLLHNYKLDYHIYVQNSDKTINDSIEKAGISITVSSEVA